MTANFPPDLSSLVRLEWLIASLVLACSLLIEAAKRLSMQLHSLWPSINAEAIAQVVFVLLVASIFAFTGLKFW